VRLVDLAAIAAQRWKNGAGWTREIAVGGGSEEAFGWRLSLAEVERDAPFSAFPGVDRCIVVLSGAGMALHDEAGELVQSLRPLEPWSFAGERVLHARLPSGPCRDFNVMTRRGAWRSETAVLHVAAQPMRGDVTLLLAARGRWRIGADEFGALQGLLLDGDAPPVAPLAADAALLHVCLCHDRQP